MDEQLQRIAASIDPGRRVFDGDGRLLGHVGAATDAGVEILPPGADRHRATLPGQSFGEGYLMWRCEDCGEMGRIDGTPDRCPACAAPRAALATVRED